MPYIGIHTSFDIGEEVYFCWLKNNIELFTVHEAKITEILVTTNDTGTTTKYRVAYVFSGVSRTCTAEEFELGRTYSSAIKSCTDELTKRSIKYFEEELNKSLSNAPKENA